MQRRLAFVLALVFTLGLAAQVPVHAALRLAGTTEGQVNHGDINALDGAAATSILWWSNFTSVSANDTIIGKISTLAFFTVTATTDWRIATNVANRQWTSPPSTGLWVHLAIVYDGSLAEPDRLKLYRDGVEQSTVSLNANPTTLPSTANSFITGGDANSGGAFVGADVAIVKVFTAALTPAEILAEKECIRPIRTANLIMWSPYDDDTAAIDYSGAGNNGTATGATQVGGPPVSYCGD